MPCNPLFIAALFTRTASAEDFARNMLHFLTRHKRTINLVAGLVMLGISVYYLVFIFGVFDFLVG